VATRCGDAKKCGNDPLYREVSRWLAKSYDASKMMLEARAVGAALGHEHARRGMVQAQVWAAQMAYRKIHPEVKAPIAITEEDETPGANDGVEIVRGEIATIAPPSHGAVKITFKDSTPWKQCTEADIEGFEGATDETRVVYKQNCVDHPAGSKIEPFVALPNDVLGLKPGTVIVAAVSGAGDARRGIVAQVIAGDKVIQLGPDKFRDMNADPLSTKP
jgi:hypothetical protein